MSSQVTNPNENIRHSASSVASPGSMKFMRTIGYGLLALSILDLVAMVVPFDFKNPVWEFQRFGELVERSAVPLIGLATFIRWALLTASGINNT
ncbi:MAG: HpsJ family protein, partial [Cyanobacteria bacterium J06555_13]